MVPSMAFRMATHRSTASTPPESLKQNAHNRDRNNSNQDNQQNSESVVSSSSSFCSCSTAINIWRTIVADKSGVARVRFFI